MSRVRTGKMLGGIEILRHKDFTAIPVTLDSTVEADGKSVVEEGCRKIIKAGTILGGKEGKLLDGGTVATVKADGTAEGVLRYDVDVTDGDIEVSMIIRGEVYKDKLPAELGEGELGEGVEEALSTRILFIK